MSVTPLVLLAVACVRTSLPSRGVPEPGLIGIRYQPVPEGLVVTEVDPGMGAFDAGLVVGDLITAVEDRPVGASPDDESGGAGGLPGAPGSTVRVRVRGPLGAEERVLTLERRVRPPEARDPSVIANFERALARRGPRGAARAARALLDANFGGKSTLEAVSRAFRGPGRARPRVAVAAARVLAAGRPEDVNLQFFAGEALLRVDAAAEAAERLWEVERLRPPDLWWDGGRGDLGGNPVGRSLLATALFRQGQRQAAEEVARALTRTREASALLDELGLEAEGGEQPWSVLLPPAPPVGGMALGGTAWSSADHRGQPVLVVFWATWCGPCLEELPHVQALWERRRAAGLRVVGISVDDLADRPAVERTVEKLKLSFPVIHDPSLALPFAVGPIPALRLLGRGGEVRYASTGYSPAGVRLLDARVQEALDTPAGSATPIGKARGPGRLRAFLPLSGVEDVAPAAQGLVVGVAGAPPVAVRAAGETWAAEPVNAAARSGTPRGARVAWLDGPVVVDPGRPWVRAWDEAGEERWFLTTPAPVSDLVVAGERLWLATAAEVLVLDASGAVQARHPGGAVALEAGEGGVWAAGEDQRLFFGEHGRESRGASPDAARVGPGGQVASKLIGDLVVGRFGPGGAPRAVASRRDGAVIGLDGAGTPSFTLFLDEGARLAAWDPDGDGRDALVLTLAGKGLVWAELSLP